MGQTITFDGSGSRAYSFSARVLPISALHLSECPHSNFDVLQASAASTLPSIDPLPNRRLGGMALLRGLCSRAMATRAIGLALVHTLWQLAASGGA